MLRTRSFLHLACLLGMSGIVLSGSLSIFGCASNTEIKANDEPYTLEIMHVGDLHSYLEPNQKSFTINNKSILVNVGGVEALSAEIQKRRDSNPNLLVVSAGDQIVGHEQNYDMFIGEVDAKVHGIFGTDVFILGDSEFAKGTDNLVIFLNYMQKFAPKAHLVSTNINLVGENEVAESDAKEPKAEESEEPKHDLQDFLLSNYKMQIDGHEVSFYSFTDKTKIYKDYQVDHEIVISRLEESLKKNAVNDSSPVKILVTHQGIGKDKQIASRLKDFDIIIGGDSHSLCGDFKDVGIKGKCSYPITVTNIWGKKVCVVHASENGDIVGDLKVKFNQNGEVLSCGGNPIMPIYTESATTNDSSITDPEAIELVEQLINQNSKLYSFAEKDPKMTKSISDYVDNMHARNTQKLGNALEDLCSTVLPTTPCHIKNKADVNGSEVCQVFGKAIYEDLGAQIVILPSGGFGKDIARGDFSLATLRGIFSQPQDIIRVNLTGLQVRKLLNNMTGYTLRTKNSNYYDIPCGYGLTFDMRTSKTSGNQVSDIRILKNGEYVHINDQEHYSVIINSYMKAGKNGYLLLKKLPVEENYGSEIQYFEGYLEKYGQLPYLETEHMMLKHFYN